MVIYGGLCPRGHRLEFQEIFADVVVINCSEGHWNVLVPVYQSQELMFIDRRTDEK